jgi:hypothetical protein
MLWNWEQSIKKLRDFIIKINMFKKVKNTEINMFRKGKKNIEMFKKSKI